MAPEDYGDKYHQHLLEQYKLYVQIIDNTTNQRGITNKFYITVLSALIAVLSFLISNTLPHIIILTVSLLGLFLCSVWYIHIKSYRQLNSGRFKVIHDMEAQLPFRCFGEEWKHLKKGRGNDYIRLTKVEQKIPIFLGIPFLMIAIYYLMGLLSGH